MILSRDFVESHIASIKRDIKGLKGFVSLGNELSRMARYKSWLAELEAYYAENYQPLTNVEWAEKKIRESKALIAELQRKGLLSDD